MTKEQDFVQLIRAELQQLDAELAELQDRRLRLDRAYAELDPGTDRRARRPAVAFDMVVPAPVEKSVSTEEAILETEAPQEGRRRRRT